MLSSGSIFTPQVKSGQKILDPDGKEIKVDVREDEEQQVKLQEMLDLLVAAGYFRARIKGLSAFDKVVGGLTWCLEMCSYDIDVDLLFQENLTIGQKISLTEKLVAALPQMKCPHRIEPHQIQGLDFIHVFPVIQWLVKRSLEAREERAQRVRAHALLQYDHAYKSDLDDQSSIQSATALLHIQSVQETYRPVRKFRRRSPPNPDENISYRVRSTLLEYGQCQATPFGLGSADKDSFADKENQRKETETEEQSEFSPEEAAKLHETKQADEVEAIMKNMASAEDSDSRLSASTVGGIVNLQAEELALAADRYANLLASSESKLTSTGRALQALRRREAELTEKEGQLLAQVKELREKVETGSQITEKRREELRMLDGGLEELDRPENRTVLQQLHSLVEIHDCLKLQEQQFRENCHSELNRLQALVKEAVEQVRPNPEETSGSDGETENGGDSLEAERARVNALRLQLARTSRATATLQRQLDDVPGRAELAQYQRRFLELYNQVAAKHKETKQYYTLYNTLDDTKLYLAKELNLLDSVLENYHQAMSSPSTKESFIKQFEAIVEGVRQNKTKVEHRRNEERQKRDRLSKQQLSLIELERSYVAAVRQLTIECRRNELLMAQLRGS